MTSVVVDLYRDSAGSDAVSVLFRACESGGMDSALITASRMAAKREGVAICEFLLDALACETDWETDNERGVDLTWSTCESALQAIDAQDAIAVLLTAHANVVDSTGNSRIVEMLRKGREEAAGYDGHLAVKALLDSYRQVSEFADDPWGLLGALIKTFAESREQTTSPEVAEKVWLAALVGAAAADGFCGPLWDYYRMDYLGDVGDAEMVEPLQKAYEGAFRAVRDPRAVLDLVFDTCRDDIAMTGDDLSFWLPDRVQVFQACKAAIEAVGGPTAPLDVLLSSFPDAVSQTDDSWALLLKTFQDTVESTSDPSLTISFLFDAYARAIEEARNDRVKLVGALSDAVRAAQAHPLAIAHALGSELECLGVANEPKKWTPELLYSIYAGRAEEDPEWTIQVMVDAAKKAICGIDDPVAKCEMLSSICTDAIADGDSPELIVDALLDAAREAIATADDETACQAGQALMDGLLVRPRGWPPPRPIWLHVAV